MSQKAVIGNAGGASGSQHRGDPAIIRSTTVIGLRDGVNRFLFILSRACGAVAGQQSRENLIVPGRKGRFGYDSSRGVLPLNPA